MFQHRPWPFADDQFPRELGAVVQRTVLSGERPALVVIHTEDNGWVVGDDTTDPNEPDACIATHIWHAIERNSSIAKLGNLAPGFQAKRASPTSPWVISQFEYAPES